MLPKSKRASKYSDAYLTAVLVKKDEVKTNWSVIVTIAHRHINMAKVILRPLNLCFFTEAALLFSILSKI